MNISKYFPINTQEKVDALLSEIKSTHNFNELELIILLEIRKVNIQFYLKDKLSQLRQSGKIKLVAKRALKPNEEKKMGRVTTVPKSKTSKILDKRLPAPKQLNKPQLKRVISGFKVPLSEHDTRVLSDYKERLIGKSIDCVAIHFGESTRLLLQWAAKYKIKATASTIISEQIFHAMQKELADMISAFKAKKRQAWKAQEEGLFSSSEKISSRFDDDLKRNFHKLYRG